MTITIFDSDSANHRYTITTDTRAAIGVMGCFNPSDKHTKAHVNNVFGAEDSKPDIVFLLGDLIYHKGCDDGIKSADDLKQLNTLMQSLPNTPVFMAYGNHEGRIHGGRRKFVGGAERSISGTAFSEHWVRSHFRKGYYDRQALQGWAEQPQLSQVDARSKHGAYMRRDNGQWIFRNEPNNKLINYGSSSACQFNMGSDGYYVVHFKLDRGRSPYCDMIVLDTNTLPYDDMQRQWLTETINASSAEKIILVGHHGVMTPVFDKRSTSVKDAKLYADANAELMAEKEADVREPTVEQRETLTMRQADARDKVKARYEQLVAVAGLDHVAVLNYVYHQEISPVLTHQKAAKIKINLCAHAHNLQVIATPKGNTLVVGGGMGGKLNKVLTHYGQETGHLLYGDKVTGVAILKLGNVLQGRLVAGLPHESIGDSPLQERASFEIDLSCNLAVTLPVKDNVENKTTIQRIPDQGWIVRRTATPVGEEPQLLSTRGWLKEARGITNQNAQGQQVISVLPGPLNMNSDFLHASKQFEFSINALATAAGFRAMETDVLIQQMLPLSQSRMVSLFCSAEYANKHLYQVKCIVHQARHVSQLALKQHLDKGPWQAQLNDLLLGLSGVQRQLTHVVSASGLEQLSLTDEAATSLLQRLASLQRAHGQAHRTLNTAIIPTLIATVIVVLAYLLILGGDVIFGGSMNLKTELGDGGALLFAMFIAQMVGRWQSRRADEGMNVEVTKYLRLCKALVLEVKSQPEHTYESLDDVEAGRRCCLG